MADELIGKMETDFANFLETIGNPPQYSEDELLQNMGKSAFEFDSAHKFLAKYAGVINKRRAKLRTIILAKRFDLLQNDALKAHLESCFSDIKFKPTKEDLDNFIDVELGIMAEQVAQAEDTAKKSEKLHDMWQKQISWYQSVLKRETAELMTLNRGT